MLGVFCCCFYSQYWAVSVRNSNDLKLESEKFGFGELVFLMYLTYPFELLTVFCVPQDDG